MIIRDCLYNNLQKVVICLCLTTAILFIPTHRVMAATILQNCNTYKLSPELYTARLDELTDKIARLIADSPALGASMKKGEDLTDEVYSAGLLGRIDDCKEDPRKPNFQVIGGDILSSDGHGDTSGFTLVVRLLPHGHCKAVSGLGRVDRRVLVRPEIADKGPGSFGTCVGNPVTKIITLGKDLPMPNTAYLYQMVKLKPPPESADPTTEACKFPSVLNECVLWNQGKASSSQIATCKSAIDRVELASYKIRALDIKGNLLYQSPKQRERLLFGLAEAPVMKEDPKGVDKLRRQMATLLYKTGSNNNLDPAYWVEQLGEYDKLISRIRAAACRNGWQDLFAKPELWRSMSAKDKYDIFQQVYKEFAAVTHLKLRGPGINFVDYTVLYKLRMILFGGVYTEAGYVPPGNKDYPDSIIMLKHSYDGKWYWPADFKYALRVILEELMHGHQRELWEEQLYDHKLPVDSMACVQASMFFYNAILYTKGEVDEKAYESQPLELHAKRYSTYTINKLFGTPLSCK